MSTFRTMGRTAFAILLALMLTLSALVAAASPHSNGYWTHTAGNPPVTAEFTGHHSASGGRAYASTVNLAYSCDLKADLKYYFTSNPAVIYTISWNQAQVWAPVGQESVAVSSRHRVTNCWSSTSSGWKSLHW